MTEQEKYAKFWAVFAEKLSDVQKEYNDLSDDNKRRVSETAKCTLTAYGINWLFQLIQNPPQ